MFCIEYNPNWLQSLEPASLPEWIQLIVSVFGLCALIRTLRLQIKATNNQAKATLIEDERDRRSLMPIFEVKEFQNREYVNPHYIEIKLAKNDASFIQISSLSSYIQFDKREGGDVLGVSKIVPSMREGEVLSFDLESKLPKF